ncbi:HEPN domain-containing protein [Cyanobium sp. BA5m-10]|uniref:HEPN domain-containing protein n=1 Tax=Cyanobium sp. BA5m-10 TaxID=2823705 RepID=UPI0020CB890F|nr:HEPN domain-containing protein [Cyanobium sp. BA5m-10]
MSAQPVLMPASLLVVVPTLNSHALLLGSTLPPGPLRPRLSPPPIAQALATEVQDLEDRLRILDALYIPTRYPDSLPEGAPTDHFGRLQSQDALRHARALVDAISSALAPA